MCCNVQDSIPFPSKQTGKERYSEPLAADFISLMRSAGFAYEKGIIWYKGPGTATQRLFGSFPIPGLLLISGLTEHILLLRKPRNGYSRQIPLNIKQASEITNKEWSKWTLDLWDIRPETSQSLGHPAPFPAAIPYRLIRMFTFIGDIVLDPFMGSGSTAYAAKISNRQYIGYEIHNEYIQIANGRLRKTEDIFEERNV